MTKNFCYTLKRSSKKAPVVTACNLNTRKEKQLDPAPSLAIHCHSPDGFEWGYNGSGPAQLALAIMFDYFTKTLPRACSKQYVTTMALNWYQDFKRSFISPIPTRGGIIHSSDIQYFIDQASAAKVRF